MNKKIDLDCVIGKFEIAMLLINIILCFINIIFIKNTNIKYFINGYVWGVNILCLLITYIRYKIMTHNVKVIQSEIIEKWRNWYEND